MVQSFKKLKKRAAIRTVSYSVLLGCSLALILFGGLFIFFKRTEQAFPWWGYVLCGGVALLGFGLTLLIGYPTTKRFAKKLDSTYSLGERVQTMIEFAAIEGEIVELQRIDTEHALSTLPKKKKGAWQFFKVVIPPVLAAASVTASLLIPAKVTPPPAPTPPPKEEVFEAEWFDIADLETLIKNVDESELSEDLQRVYLTSLEDLLTLLTAETPPPKAQVLSAVSLSMELILSVTTQANSYNALYLGMKEKTELTSLAKGLKDSGWAYQALGDVNVFNYDTLTGKKKDLYGKITEFLTTYRADLEAKLDEAVGGLADTEAKAAFVAYVTEYTKRLDEVFAVDGVKAVPETDELKVGVKTLKEKLFGLIAELDNGYSLEGVKGLASTYIKEFHGETGVTSALSEQAYTFMMKEYVLENLGKIFKVNPPKDPLTEEEESKPGDNTSGGGGELNYPNSGLVLDPSDGKLKPYGELLSTYYNRIMKLTETEEGEEPKISEELKGYIEAYFKALQTK